MTDENPYKILGIKSDATAPQITAAYRRQAKENHPDKHAEKSEIERNAYAQQFHRATWAYEILRDPQSRAYFDKHGRVRSAVRDNNLNAVDRTLIETFRTILTTQRDLRRTDLIYKIRLKLTDDQMGLQDEVRRIKTNLEEYRTLLDRFVRNDDAENVLTDSIREDITQMTAMIEAKTTQVNHLKACLIELKSWRYITDEDRRARTSVTCIAYA
jgi:curved DNA-binding protein CbpA